MYAFNIEASVLFIVAEGQWEQSIHSFRRAIVFLHSVHYTFQLEQVSTAALEVMVVHSHS
jgi:hypothetical protein